MVTPTIPFPVPELRGLYTAAAIQFEHRPVADAIAAGKSEWEVFHDVPKLKHWTITFIRYFGW